MRSGPWKLDLPLDEKLVALNRRTAPARQELFDVRSDPGETREVSAGHPEVVRRLTTLADAARLALGDRNRLGRGQRPAGFVAEPQPLINHLGKKRDGYRRNGVREYLVWRVLDRKVDWFVNREGRFELMLVGADGILRSTVFPGLWLEPAALVRGETTMVIAILHQGLNSPEHADFAARLEQARIV